jgi:hypothetical protein
MAKPPRWALESRRARPPQPRGAHPTLHLATGPRHPPGAVGRRPTRERLCADFRDRPGSWPAADFQPASSPDLYSTSSRTTARSWRSPASSGTNPNVCLSTYAHVMAEPDDDRAASAEEQIMAARRAKHTCRSAASGPSVVHERDRVAVKTEETPELQQALCRTRTGDPFLTIESATSQGVHRRAKRPRVGGPCWAPSPSEALEGGRQMDPTNATPVGPGGRRRRRRGVRPPSLR